MAALLTSMHLHKNAVTYIVWAKTNKLETEKLENNNDNYNYVYNLYSPEYYNKHLYETNPIRED